MRRNRLIVHVLVIVLVAIVLAPFLWLVRMSFETNAQIFAFPPRLWFSPTLSNYAALWQSEFRHSFANSAIVSVTSTVIALVVTMMAGVARAQAALLSRFAIGIWRRPHRDSLRRRNLLAVAAASRFEIRERHIVAPRAIAGVDYQPVHRGVQAYSTACPHCI